MNILGLRPNSQVSVRYTQLQLQTSAQGVCIPLVYGANVIAPNLIWQGDFQSHQVGGKGGGKGGGGKGSGQYTYTDAVILGLCEGPIFGLGTCWSGGTAVTLSSLNLTLFTGTQTQTPPAWMVSNFPAQAESYAYTAYLFSSLFDLGSSASLPSLKFEVAGILYDDSVEMPLDQDANFADIIHDYLTNPQYGVLGFPSSVIDTGGLAFYRNYCLAQGLFASPAMDSQEQALTTLQRWAMLSNTWIFWSGDKLKFVPLGDSVIVANGTTFNPILTPVYDLGPDDFIFDATSEDPVTVDRIDPADGYNRVELDCRDRANGYVSTPVYWEDQASVDLYGLLQSNTVSCTEICNLTVATNIAALVGQRSVFIRNTYKFKLPHIYVLLEQGDLITLTEPNIGLSATPVRVKLVEEGTDMLLTITAEEFPGTVGTPLYPRTQQDSAGQPNPSRLVDPGDVNPPAIFEPTPSITGGIPQVWIGLSGGPNWGGADIYLSADGTNYTWLGQIVQPCQQGVTTTDLLAGGTAVSVDMVESNSILSTAVTAGDAAAGRTASLVDNEVLSYGTVTPTGTFTADLSGIDRGSYNTAPAHHPVGSQFTRINPSAIFLYNLPKAYVGVTLYFKFTSFNVFGAETQDISSVVQYTYVPSGVAYTIAPPTSVTLGLSRVTQADGTTILVMTAGWGASAGPDLGSYSVEWSTDGGTTWGVAQTVPSNTLIATLQPAVASTSYQARVAAVSTSGLAVSAFVTSPVVNSGGLVAAVPGAPTGVSATPGHGNAIIAWTPPASGPTTSYEVYRAPGLGASFGSAAIIATVPTSPWTDASVLPVTPYTWFVVAVNAAGAGSPSAGADCTTLVTPTSLPAAPTGVTATPGPAQALIGFSEPTTGGPWDSFQVWRANGLGASFGAAALIAQTPGAPFTDNGVNGGGAYTWFIVATNKLGSGTPSPGADCTVGVAVGAGTNLYVWDGVTPPPLASWASYNATGGTGSTQENLGQSVTIVDTGLALINVRGLYIAVPVASPYRRAKFLQNDQANFCTFAGPVFGWTDGTKFEGLQMTPNGFFHVQFSNATTRVLGGGIGGTAAGISAILWSEGFWAGLRDDGTNVYLELSKTGASTTFQTIFQITKSTGYLGGSGYTNTLFGMIPQDNTTPMAISIRAMDDNALSGRQVG